MFCGDRVVLHCDANNFFASCECLSRPELATLPVAVAGNPKTRTGVILAKNEVAKGFGIKTGEVLWQAKQKCPSLVCLAPHMELYEKISKKIVEIYKDYTDVIEPFGIDECWLDITHSKHLFCGGDPEMIAHEIKERVKREIGLTLSCGVSFGKLLAKLASDLKKPDAVTVLDRSNFKQKIYDMPASCLLGVGRKNEVHLLKMNIRTVGDIAAADEKILKSKFGINGVRLKQKLLGYDTDPVVKTIGKENIKSVSNSTTTLKDIHTRAEIQRLVLVLADKVCSRLREYGYVASKIGIGIKNEMFEKDSRQQSLGFFSDNANEICKNCMQLLDTFFCYNQNIRSVRVCAFGLKKKNTFQASFFDEDMQKNRTLNCAIDCVRKKYGSHSIVLGSYGALDGILNTDKV